MERIKILITQDIDLETGEVITVSREIINDDIKKVTKKSSKKAKVNDDSAPKLILEANKYTLTTGAITLLGIDTEEENRFDIKYDKKGKSSIPVFGTSVAFGTPSKGNKLTKSLTVPCRGKANEELSTYGSVFTLTPHPTKEGLFILTDENAEVPETPDGDENVSVPEQPLSIPEDDDDLDLEGLIDGSEDGGFNFNLN